MGKIQYFYSDRRVVHLVTAEREYPFYSKLDDVEKALSEGFLRIHQRYLVRTVAVDQMSESSVLVGGKTLPVSRNHREQAMAALARAVLRRNRL